MNKNTAIPVENAPPPSFVRVELLYILHRRHAAVRDALSNTMVQSIESKSHLLEVFMERPIRTVILVSRDQIRKFIIMLYPDKMQEIRSSGTKTYMDGDFNLSIESIFSVSLYFYQNGGYKIFSDSAVLPK